MISINDLLLKKKPYHTVPSHVTCAIIGASVSKLQTNELNWDFSDVRHVCLVCLMLFRMSFDAVN